MLGWLTMLVGNKIASDARSNRLSEEYVKENGLDHPEWNKELQMRLWRKWVNTQNDRTMTQVEQYHSAVAELESQGYKWNPVWNPFTPKASSYLTAASEKSAIENNKEEVRRSNYLRNGENMQLQYEILKYCFWGSDLITNNDFTWFSSRSETQGSFGDKLHSDYTYRVRLSDESNTKDTLDIPLQEILDMIIPPEILVNKTEKQIESILKNVFSITYKTGKVKNIFDPPRIFFLSEFVWYDNIIHYPFSDTFIPRPSAEKLKTLGQSEYSFSNLRKDRQCSFEKNIETYFYRNLPDGHKWYIETYRTSSDPVYINVKCSK